MVVPTRSSGHAHGVLVWSDVTFGDGEASCVSSDPRHGGTPASSYLTNVFFVDTPVQLAGGAHFEVYLEIGTGLRISVESARV